MPTVEFPQGVELEFPEGLSPDQLQRRVRHVLDFRRQFGRMPRRVTDEGAFAEPETPSPRTLAEGFQRPTEEPAGFFGALGRGARLGAETGRQILFGQEPFGVTGLVRRGVERVLPPHTVPGRLAQFGLVPFESAERALFAAPSAILQGIAEIQETPTQRQAVRDILPPFLFGRSALGFGARRPTVAPKRVAEAPVPRETQAPLFPPFRESPPILPGRPPLFEGEDLVIPRRVEEPARILPTQAQIAERRAGIERVPPAPQRILPVEERPPRLVVRPEAVPEPVEPLRGPPRIPPTRPSVFPPEEELGFRQEEAARSIAEQMRRLRPPVRAPEPIPAPPRPFPPVTPAEVPLAREIPPPRAPRAKPEFVTDFDLDDPLEWARVIGSRGGLKPGGALSGELRAVPNIHAGRTIKSAKGLPPDELVGEIAEARGLPPVEVETRMLRALTRLRGASQERRVAQARPEAELPTDLAETLGITPEEFQAMSPAQKQATIAFGRAEGERPPPIDRPVESLPQFERAEVEPSLPRFERTEAGEQGVIPGTPTLAMPPTPLRADRPQADLRDTPLFGQERAARDTALEAAQETIPTERTAPQPPVPTVPEWRNVQPPPGVLDRWETADRRFVADQVAPDKWVVTDRLKGARAHASVSTFHDARQFAQRRSGPQAPGKGPTPLGGVVPPIPVPSPPEEEREKPKGRLQQAAQIAGLTLPLFAAFFGRGRGIRVPRRPSVEAPVTPLQTAREVGRQRAERFVPPSPQSLRPPRAPEPGYVEPPGPPSPHDGRSVFDPNVPPNRPPEATYWDRLNVWRLRFARKNLPRELAIARRIPDSPVISDFERFHSNLSDGLSDIIVNSKLREVTPDEWVVGEHRALLRRRAGGSEEEILSEMPAQQAAYVRARRGRFAAEQEARDLLGLDEFDESPFPYVPRRIQETGAETVRVFRGQTGGYGADLRTSLGSFAKTRRFDSAVEGQLAGQQYEDPRLSALWREWVGLRLRETGTFISGLEQKGVLFRDPVSAKKASPTGQSVLVENFVPNGRQWWARSADEAAFIRHQFQEKNATLGGLVHYANVLARNPNLLNPIPHFAKNMLPKYILAGGNPARLPRDLIEYFTRSTPALRERFDRVMPFSKTGRLAHDLLEEELTKLSGSALRQRLSQVLRWVEHPNFLSGKVLFTWGDPALRYSLWKKYLRQGFSDQAAANNVWVDLIRYGKRSDLIDFWKSLPLNFFVPWRFGSVQSLAKQTVSYPIRTALLIGGIDYLRELRYRKTGRWVHVPWDYIEGPIATLIERRDARTMLAVGSGTALFGPGGAFAASQLVDVLNTVRGNPVEWDRARNMFWGLSQFYNIPTEWAAFQKTGDLRHLTNVLTGAVLGEHAAISYAPARFGRVIPEGALGLSRSSQMKTVEALQQRAKFKREHREIRQEQRPSPPRFQTEEERQLESLMRRAR